jgi:hypothetical protein
VVRRDGEMLEHCAAQGLRNFSHRTSCFARAFFRSACFCIARGSGEAVKLNMALVLLPVSRLATTLLWNRSGNALPLYSAVSFHQVGFDRLRTG